MDFSLFDEASRDHEEEARERRTAMVRSDVVASLMPFLGMASSQEEYATRKALVSDGFSVIALRHQASAQEVETLADRMYDLLAQARRREDGLVYVASAMECSNCGHKSTDHSEGLRCGCGCTDFTPATGKQAMRREAGEGSGPFS